MDQPSHWRQKNSGKETVKKAGNHRTKSAVFHSKPIQFIVLSSFVTQMRKNLKVNEINEYKWAICREAIFSIALRNIRKHFILVGGLEHQFYFPIYKGNVIIPIDELIFFRGVAQPATSICLPWMRKNDSVDFKLGIQLGSRLQGAKGKATPRCHQRFSWEDVGTQWSFKWENHVYLQLYDTYIYIYIYIFI